MFKNDRRGSVIEILRVAAGFQSVAISFHLCQQFFTFYIQFALVGRVELGDGFDIDVDGDHIHIDKDDDNHNECRVGVNIGGGADFALTSSWIMNFELRYQLVSDFDQAVFNLGFAYRF